MKKHWSVVLAPNNRLTISAMLLQMSLSVGVKHSSFNIRHRHMHHITWDLDYRMGRVSLFLMTYFYLGRIPLEVLCYSDSHVEVLHLDGTPAVQTQDHKDHIIPATQLENGYHWFFVHCSSNYYGLLITIYHDVWMLQTTLLTSLNEGIFGYICLVSSNLGNA